MHFYNKKKKQFEIELNNAFCFFQPKITQTGVRTLEEKIDF